MLAYYLSEFAGKMHFVIFASQEPVSLSPHLKEELLAKYIAAPQNVRMLQNQQLNEDRDKDYCFIM